VKVKEGDTFPNPESVLSDASGDQVNLSGATVRFRMAKLDGTPIFERAAVIDNNTAPAVVHYVWQTGDTATPGAYRAEWEVTYAGGIIETFPQNSYLEVLIKEKME
jgi:hypothetical protein